MFKIPELLAPAGGMEQLKAGVVPVIPNITKGWHDQNIRKHFDKIRKPTCSCGRMI